MPTSALGERLTAALHEHYRLKTVSGLSPVHYPAVDQACLEPEARFWRLDTGDEQFLLKRYKKGKRLERIEFEEDLQTNLHDLDASLVPELMATRQGALHFSLGAEQCWRLERFIQSPHYKWWHCDWSTEQCASAGRFLRRFHDVSSRLTSNWLSETGGIASGAVNIPDLSPLRGDDLEKMMLNALADAESTQPLLDTVGQGTLRCALATCRSLLELSQPALIEHTRECDGELLLVHGDFHMGNLLFSGESISAVVDYEDVRLQAPLYDLGYAALMLCSPWNLAPGTEPLPLQERFLRRFLQAYYGTECAHLPAHCVVVACMLVTSWWLKRAHLWQESNSQPLACLTRVIQVWSRYVKE